MVVTVGKRGSKGKMKWTRECDWFWNIYWTSIAWTVIGHQWHEHLLDINGMNIYGISLALTFIGHQWHEHLLDINAMYIYWTSMAWTFIGHQWYEHLLDFNDINIYWTSMAWTFIGHQWHNIYWTLTSTSTFIGLQHQMPSMTHVDGDLIAGHAQT